MPPDTMSYEEYLDSYFEPKREWVDGVAIERTGGEFAHSLTLAHLAANLFRALEESALIPLLSVSIRTREGCVRIPDLTVVGPDHGRETPLAQPPLLVIEVRSEQDSHSALSDRALEYVAFGIERVWVIDPYARVVYRTAKNGLELARSGELTIPETPIRVVPESIFAELDCS